MDPSPPIVDLHCHAAGIGAGGSGCLVSPALRRSWKFRHYLRGFDVTERELAEEGDGLVLRRLSERLAASRRVSAAVVLAMDAVVGADGKADLGRTEIHVPDRFLAAAVRRHGNLLYGASVHPYRRDALERLDEAAESGAVLVKWLPSIQGIDPADGRLAPFYRRLRHLSLPLLTHTGREGSFTRSRDDLADPERLRLPLSLGVTVVAAHGAGNGRNGGEPNFDRFLRLGRDFPHLHADLSALTQVNRPGQLARLLARRELHGRILYGTDMPLPATPVVTPFAFPLRIPLRRMVDLGRIENPWDRDVALKEALGVTAEILGNGARLLRLP